MPRPPAAAMPAASATSLSPWRDVVVALLVTFACAALAAYFELSEAMFAYTRRWEHLQLDEWPVELQVLPAPRVREHRFAQLEVRRQRRTGKRDEQCHHDVAPRRKARRGRGRHRCGRG